MADLLLEVGMEEIPARMIAAGEAELTRRVRDLLARERLRGSETHPESATGCTTALGYSTPRRLAVLLSGVPIRQPDREEQVTGPSWTMAFHGGEPAPAAIAFAKKVGVDPAALKKIEGPKGEYVSATVLRPGRSAVEVLLEHLPKEIAALSWPKTMYWRPAKPERFVRPVRWLLCLLDQEVVPIEFAGIRGKSQSYGHRILYGDEPIRIARPADYVGALESSYVLVDVEARRHRIRKSLDAAARSIPGSRWREDHALVDQVTHLTEWPTVAAGNFETEYLALPEEVLVTVMRDHQKYFAVEDAQGKLAPHFLAVLNTEVDAQGLETIRHGNERVLRARFNDARFFWDYDQKTSLLERVDWLKTVTFQKDLGSYFSKTEINLQTAKALAAAAAAEGICLDHEALEKAALLAKTDLTTELVKEFTELQGVIGGLYARAQGLGEAVAQAISRQYLPVSAEDPIPQTVEGQILGLADRMATLVEMFAIGLAPTGSKDPFALRRAANGVIKILAESGLPLPLFTVERLAIQESSRGKSSVPGKSGGPGRSSGPGKSSGSGDALAVFLSVFLKERLTFYLREQCGYAYDAVNAVLATELATVPDAVARARALSEVRGSDDLLAVSAAFKRIKNILRQAAEKGKESGANGERIVVEDLIEPAERQLYAESMKLAPQVEALRAKHQYSEALERIAALRPSVDAFFDSVMVLTSEANLRKNRLALIASVLGNFSRIADFSEMGAANPVARPPQV